MYQVFKNKKVMFKGTAFDSYERARQFLRKHIRQLVAKGKASTSDFEGRGWWDNISRNPVNFTNAGYSIAKVQ
jgi:hypothetical protein